LFERRRFGLAGRLFVFVTSHDPTDERLRFS
jgi:hypothetical protein